MDVILVEDDIFATVDEDDLDEAALGTFTLGVGHIRQLRRHLRSELENQLKVATHSSMKRRSLTVFDAVELDIVLDSYICEAYGGETNAIAQSTSIVNEANKNFESFSVKFNIKHLFVYPNASNDPIRSILTISVQAMSVQIPTTTSWHRSRIMCLHKQT